MKWILGHFRYKNFSNYPFSVIIPSRTSKLKCIINCLEPSNVVNTEFIPKIQVNEYVLPHLFIRKKKDPSEQDHLVSEPVKKRQFIRMVFRNSLYIILICLKLISCSEKSIIEQATWESKPRCSNNI